MSRTEILEGAKRLFMRYGIKSITMDDVARELGISKKTLYQHVENKTDLVRRIMENHIHGEKDCMDDMSSQSNDPIEQHLMMARYALQVLREVQPTAMYDLQKYYRDIWQEMDKFHREYLYKRIRNNLEEGMAKGYYRQDIDPDIIAKIYIGKTMLLTGDDLFPMREYQRDVLFNEFIKYHFHGVLTEKGLAKLRTYQPDFI